MTPPKKPKWLVMGAAVHCLGEGQDVFTIADLSPDVCSSMLLTANGRLHGRESWSKLSPARQPRKRLPSIELTLEELAAILRVNATDADKELPLAECLERFRRAPALNRLMWERTAHRYWEEKALATDPKRTL